MAPHFGDGNYGRNTLLVDINELSLESLCGGHFLVVVLVVAEDYVIRTKGHFKLCESTLSTPVVGSTE